MMLTLLALALPTAALANNFSVSTGAFDSGTFTAGLGTGGFALAVSGDGTASMIRIQGVRGPACTGSTCTINAGTLIVFRPNGAVLFSSPITGGTLDRGSTGATVTGTFGPNVTGVSNTGGVFSFRVTYASLSAGGALTGGVAFASTPEPSGLEGLLLGTGMLGLAEMTRRKLRLEA